MRNAMTKPTRLFLLIGLTKESAHWDDHFVNELKKQFQTEDVVAIDLPGSGEYLSMLSPLSMEGVVKETRSNYAKYLKGDSHNIMIAISLGGMVATEWIKHYPSDFERFVIINSSFKGFSPMFKRVQPKALKEFFKIFFSKSEEQREDLIIKLCSNNTEKYDQVKHKWVKIAKERPMKRINMVRQLLAATRYSPGYKPDLPTLIIAARHDRLAHFSCSEQLQKRWQADFKLNTSDKVGHAYHIDAPEELASIIYEWSHQ
jgi:pimeloyl-ACP methyl ester carboxylesterase